MPAFPEEEDGALVAKARAGDNAEPLTITELAQALKRAVEDRFGFVRLRGELSGVKRAASGHLYCCLKDDGAVLDGVMWKGGAQRLGFVPEDGIEVIATGKLTTYPGRSKYQIVIERMEIAGEGALLALLEKNRQRFAAEGLFANNRALPFAPRVIGVVTSPTGAVIRDILHRLADRFPVHVLVWPVMVQGTGSAAQVAAAVRGFGAMESGGAIPRPDLLIVARGGGSVEDLWAFNEEAVVRAIAASPIPVISAVGHETDTTLADFAADWRAPTPTAAAEMAVPVRRELVAALEDLAHRKRRCAIRPVTLGRERLEARVQRLPGLQQLLQTKVQRLDDLSERLRRGLLDRAGKGREQLGKARLVPSLLQRGLRDATGGLTRARLTSALVTRPIVERSQRLVSLARVMEQLHPDRPLARGYAMVLDTNGKAITSAPAAAKESVLAIKFADGIVQASPGTLATGMKKPAKAPTAPPPTSQPKLL
jgi:exodeoxyribonuclease VII large subunit